MSSSTKGPRTTYEHEGVVYDVIDWRFKGPARKRVQLNSRHAEGRAFVPRDSSKPVRVYHYRGMTVESSEPAVLAEQFRFSVAVQGRL